MLQVLVNVSLEKFQLQKRGMGYARVIHKKQEKNRVLKKNGQVSEISKIMGTQMPAIKKREMNWIAHDFFAKMFSKFQLREICSRSIVTYPHTCTS